MIDPALQLARAIAARLGDAGCGRPLVVYEATGSTMDDARALVRAGAAPGATVVALTQHGGRGRQGRAFISPRGGLYLTAVLAAPFDLTVAWRAGFAAVVAAQQALVTCGATRPDFDWPNDLVLDGRKVGGVLTELVTPADGEHRPAVLAGIGLNVGPDPALVDPDRAGPAGPVALHLARTGGEPLAALAAALLRELDALWPEAAADSGWQFVLQSIRGASLAARGLPVTVRRPDGSLLEGTGEAILDDGSLVVRRTDGTTVAVRYGERTWE